MQICIFQLVDRGKVSLEQIAAEMGVSEASLASGLPVICSFFFCMTIFE